MYIWRRAPRRLEFLPPWVTVLGETPTVGSKDRWGQGRQAPPAVATGGRSPSVVAHDGRIPNVVAHGGRALAPWPTTAGAGLYKGSSPCRRPLTPHSLLPPNLRLSTSLEHF
jgi:hypothetical protein